jgi:hypothetical protein
MAQRARYNIEMIVARLSNDGYRFHSNDDEQTAQTPYVPPTATATKQADWLQERFGEVPMTVLSWVRLVGDVWLVGAHPQWPESASADPLVIEVEGSWYPNAPSIRDYFDSELSIWHEWSAEDSDAGLFVLPLAPDRLHKENVSGGAPYGIILPDGCVDGRFVGETTMPFVSYLNWVFRNGGFPWPTASETEWRVKQSLAKDLLPLWVPIRRLHWTCDNAWSPAGARPTRHESAGASPVASLRHDVGVANLRSGAELATESDPVWPRLRELVEQITTARVLPVVPEAGQAVLFRLQVTAGSTLGALALNCGLLLDHGWLRILGGGTSELPDLATANGLGAPAPEQGPLGSLTVAYDVLGGTFAINGGDLPGDLGEVHYWGPDTLDWTPIGAGHTDFVHWTLSGGLQNFYQDLRWPGWVEETTSLREDQGITVYPCLAAAEGQNITAAKRGPVPFAELLAFNQDLARQLRVLPDGQSIDVIPGRWRHR